MPSNLVLCYAAASTIGAIFVFPGVRQLKVGGTNLEPPYLTGMGAVFISLMLAPVLTICTAVLTYLGTRKTILRSEDPFHRALWVMHLSHLSCICRHMYCVLCSSCAECLTACCCCASHHSVRASARLLQLAGDSHALPLVWYCVA